MISSVNLRQNSQTCLVPSEITTEKLEPNLGVPGIMCFEELSYSFHKFIFTRKLKGLEVCDPGALNTAYAGGLTFSVSFY